MSAAPAVDDRVIDRIRKVLARASTSRGASEAEAETALRMAQELLLKHNLTMADVGQAPTQEQAGAGVIETDREDIPRERWFRSLAAIIGKHCLCRTIFWPAGQWAPAMSWVGRPDNIEVARALHDWIVQQLRQRCRLDQPVDAEARTWRVGYMAGAVQRIAERLARQRARAHDDPSIDRRFGLVITKRDAENDTYLKAKYGRMVRSRQATRVDSLAFQAGRKGAEHVSLTHPGRSIAAGRNR